DYVQQVAASAPFAVTVDTQQMSRGSASAADGLSRMAQVGDLLGQLQTLAQQAITSGGDASLNAQSAGLQSQIGTLINTAGSGADNLLTGTGAQGYNYVAGSKLYLRSTDLGTKVTNALAGLDLSTASGAQAAYNLITATVLPSLADARSSLTSDAQALDSARATFDPRTAIDNQFTSIVNNISTQIATATVGSSNLLTSVADTLVFLKSSPDMYDISGHGEFDSRVTQPLTSAVDALRTGASPPTTALQQAIDALTNISIDLSGDASRMQFGTQSVTDLTAQKSQAEQAQVTTPYQGTRAAKLLVMQYLALAQDSAPSQAASLADLLGGTPSTDNILNLLA
ncbi:MAG: hypothetical protein JWM77_2066, partial [Rhodospirillales bacterium]|nr:hypothetical protein [Rhodospirillales bacterium]